MSLKKLIEKKVIEVYYSEKNAQKHFFYLYEI